MSITLASLLADAVFLRPVKSLTHTNILDTRAVGVTDSVHSTRKRSRLQRQNGGLR